MANTMITNPSVAFHTLGCKLNQAESELLAKRFIESGYRIVNGNEADICILNTCTVTHVADRKSRHLVRLLRKRNPEAFIVVTGCYGEREHQKAMQIGADLIVGNKQKMNLPDLISTKFFPTYDCQTKQPASTDRVRSFIKIQDGCNNFCTYCIVPTVRGQEYSLPVDEVIDEVKTRASDGYKEVVLTGTKIGTYKHNKVNLNHLIEQILINTDIERLHVSSLQPQEISPALINLWQDSRLCRHFHIALQSGSDTVLKQMKRHYSTTDYRDAIFLIRKTVPDVAITTDIMVGFPVEGNKEFNESYHFCQEIGFAGIHVFPYSPRPGTLAANIPEQVSDKQKKERNQVMLKLAKESANKFCESFLGKTLTVLWENEVTPGSGLYSGFSDNYIKVFTKSHQSLTNQVLPVRIVRLYKQGLWGEVIK